MHVIVKLTIIFVASVILSLFVNPERLNFLVEEVIFSSASIMVGLTIAVVGIFMGNINSLYLSLLDLFNETKSISVNEKNKIINKLNSIKRELRENTMFTVCAFILILILFFIKELDLPNIAWPIDSQLVTKKYVINTIIVALNFSIVLAVYDSIMGAFKLSDALEITKK